MASTPQSMGRAAAADRRKAEEAAAKVTDAAPARRKRHVAARRKMFLAANAIPLSLAQQIVAAADDLGGEGAEAFMAALRLATAGA